MHEFLDSRKINFRFNNKNFKGYKILKSCIDKKILYKVPEEFINKKNMSVLKKLDDNKNLEIDIKILDSDQNFYYIEPKKNISDLELNNKLINILDNKLYELRDSKKIYGVYIYNSGVAEFKKINLDFDLIDQDLDLSLDKNNKSYIILNKSLNLKLRACDKILVIKK
jgi:hypothetical protein